MAGIDINRTTTGVYLPPAVSTDIWQSTQDESAVMALATPITLPGSGITIPIITGDADAEWVNETDEKPVDRPTVGRKDMTPYKLAVIVPFSNEFRRDLPALYNALAARIPNALARKFDETVFGDTAPGSNFDTLGAAAAVGIGGNTWAGLVAARSTVAAGGGVLDGWALAPQADSLLLNAEMPGTGGLLLVTNPRTDATVPSLLGAPVYTTKGAYEAGTPNRLGFAGDWTSSHYGTVEGVQVQISDQATITDGTEQLNLWQRNMFAVRAEVEVGFVVRDLAHFVQLTDAEQA